MQYGMSIAPLSSISIAAAKTPPTRITDHELAGRTNDVALQY
jgi:hypothetical protein